MFYINFESFKLTMDLKLLIVVVLISNLILFFHLVYYHNQWKESAFGYEICSLPVRDIRDGAGIGLLILLLTGMETNQLALTRVYAGMRNNCIIECRNGTGMTHPQPTLLSFKQC